MQCSWEGQSGWRAYDHDRWGGATDRAGAVGRGRGGAALLLLSALLALLAGAAPLLLDRRHHHAIHEHDIRMPQAARSSRMTTLK